MALVQQEERWCEYDNWNTGRCDNDDGRGWRDGKHNGSGATGEGNGTSMTASATSLRWGS